MVHRSQVDLILDEIIFKDRNKEYGAYELRRAYNSNLIKSVTIAFLLFTLALLSPKIVGLFIPFQKEVLVVPPIIYDPFTFPDIILEKPNVPTVAPAQTVTNKNIAPVITKNEKVIDAVLPLDTKDVISPAGTGNPTLTDKNTGLIPTFGTAEIPATKTEEPAVVWVGTKQTFKGELNKFLGNKINYPTLAQNSNISGRVFVEFVIEKDGSVSNVKTVKGIGFGCDEEAERVIKLTSGMWTPGEKNGHPVRLKMVQAIYFKMPENQ